MSIQNLVTTLQSLSDIHVELLKLGREKQQLVIENNVDQLMAITAKETKAISAMEQLNRNLTEYTGQCLKELGLTPKPDSTLADVIQATYQADSKKMLTEAAERLRDLVRQFKQLNDQNQLLVRQSLNYIGFQLDLLAGPADDVTYSPTQVANNGLSRRTFDTRA